MVSVMSNYQPFLASSCDFSLLPPSTPLLNESLIEVPSFHSVIVQKQASFQFEDCSRMVEEWMSNATLLTAVATPIPVFTFEAPKVTIPEHQVISTVPVHIRSTPVPQAQFQRTQIKMESFSSDQVLDFKRVVYNLLVENFNDPTNCTFVKPISVQVAPGFVKEGFQFNDAENPEKKLPELYAQHIRKAPLDKENQSSVFIQDLYKFYLRSCLELLSKYFDKKDKYTFLYDDISLFVPNGTLEDAEERISRMSTRQRKRNATDKPKSQRKRNSEELSEEDSDTPKRKIRKQRK